MRKNRIISLTVAAAITLGFMFPVGITASAASDPDNYIFDLTNGDITITAPDSDNITVTYGSSSTKTFAKTQPFTILGNGLPSSNKILVNGATASILLENVYSSTSDNVCAFELKNGADVTLTLKAGTTNTFSSGRNKAGIQVPSGTTLRIAGESTGTLNVTGGDLAAGIGGGYATAGGTISISGGIVFAAGGECSAGIGGGCFAYSDGFLYGTGGNITISGGSVTATGGEDASGIGGGAFAAAGTIVISGGSVTAIGGDSVAYSGGPGIGSSLSASMYDSTSPGSVTIGSAASVTAATPADIDAVITKSGTLEGASTAKLL